MMYFKAEHIIVDVDAVDTSYTLALVQQCYTTIVMAEYELKKRHRHELSNAMVASCCIGQINEGFSRALLLLFLPD